MERANFRANVAASFFRCGDIERATTVVEQVVEEEREAFVGLILGILLQMNGSSVADRFLHAIAAVPLVTQSASERLREILQAPEQQNIAHARKEKESPLNGVSVIADIVEHQPRTKRLSGVSTEKNRSPSGRVRKQMMCDEILFPSPDVPILSSGASVEQLRSDVLPRLRVHIRSRIALLVERVNECVSMEEMQSASADSGHPASAATIRANVFYMNEYLASQQFSGHIGAITGTGYRLVAPLPLPRDTWVALASEGRTVASVLVEHRGHVVDAWELVDTLDNDRVLRESGDENPDKRRAALRLVVMALRKHVPIVTVPRIGYLYDPLPLLPHALQSDLTFDEHSVLSFLLKRQDIFVPDEAIRQEINERRQSVEKGDDWRYSQLMHDLQSRFRAYAWGQGVHDKQRFFLLRRKKGYVLTKHADGDAD